MSRCFLLLVDGLRPDVAEAEMAAGRLPNFARLTQSGGRSRAVSAFPSTTSVAYLPFLTGCLPGTCDVPSIRWMDRAAYGGRWWRDRNAIRSYCGYQAGMLDTDITPDIQTIFQLVPESLGLFTMIARGLTPERDPLAGARKFWGGVGHYAEWHQPSDDAVAARLLRSVDEPWRFVFAQFPAVDGYSHQSTPSGPKVLRALYQVDAVVGQLIAALERRGELHDSLVLMVSDHGSSVVHTHLDLADWFRARGVPTLAHPIMWTRQPRAAVMVAGNASAAVYARPGVRRQERWPLQRLRLPDAFGSTDDLIAALTREPAVAFVAGADEQRGLRLANAEGEATLREAAGRITYTPLTGDPLRLGKVVAGTPEGWLDATFESEFPDAAIHLLDQFRSHRAGDLVVIANEGYDFRKRFEIPEHKSGHGSLIRAHMLTPVWSNRPLPQAALRTIDLFPAMLDWLRVPAPAGIDSRPIWLPRTETAPAVPAYS